MTENRTITQMVSSGSTSVEDRRDAERQGAAHCEGKETNHGTLCREPFIKRFKTPRALYVYDVNTNRILEVDGPVYDILGDYGHLTLDKIRQKYTPRYGASCVEQALTDIEDACKNENVFLPDRPQILDFGLSPEELQHQYETKVGCITLEVTEHCNLKCHYCTWEYLRTGKRKRMSVKTALTAIDFLRAHSSSVEQCSLGFYGGEPLLEFELIKQCVDYARSKFGDKGVRFHFTTNATLLDEEKAHYLAENQFGILVSIDGPAQIHNRHRVDKQGIGSYERAINGLRNLLKAYGENFNDKIGINAVVTPPNDLDAIYDLWKENPWLPKNIDINIDFVSATWTTFFQDYACEEENVYSKSRGNQLLSFKAKTVEGERAKPAVGRSLFEKALLRIYKRPLWQAPGKSYCLNGCCIPGVRKLLVGCDGTFYICESAHGVPPIGSLWDGYDYSVIQNIIDAYATESIRDCKNCWAVSLCNLCFAQAYFNGSFSLEHKRTFCQSVRESLEEKLKLYCSILEENKNALDYMKSMKLV